MKDNAEDKTTAQFDVLYLVCKNYAISRDIPPHKLAEMFLNMIGQLMVDYAHSRTEGLENVKEMFDSYYQHLNTLEWESEDE